MVGLGSIIAEIDRIWPLAGADDWDNVGLLVGDPRAEINTVAVAVDVTEATLHEAISNSAQLLIAHHPLILSAQKSVLTSDGIGRLIHGAIKSNLAIFSLHTNADHPEFGVSETLARTLGLTHTQPLDESTGHGRLGQISPQPLEAFVTLVANSLPHCNAPIRVAGQRDRIIERVAVLAGSGGSFATHAISAEVDAFLTSDLKHHQALDILCERKSGVLPPALIDVSHWAAERLWLDVVHEKLGSAFPDLRILVASAATDPWTFSVQP